LGYAKREVDAMNLCQDHPYIIQLKAFDLDYSKLYYGSIYMQYCELDSLDGLISRISKRGERLPDEDFLWKVFWDMSLALAFL
jgi:hypothetical protein